MLNKLKSLFNRRYVTLDEWEGFLACNANKHGRFSSIMDERRDYFINRCDVLESDLLKLSKKVEPSKQALHKLKVDLLNKFESNKDDTNERLKLSMKDLYESLDSLKKFGVELKKRIEEIEEYDGRLTIEKLESMNYASEKRAARVEQQIHDLKIQFDNYIICNQKV